MTTAVDEYDDDDFENGTFLFQVIKLLLMIIIAFLLSWGPKLTLNILQKLQLSFLYDDKTFYLLKVCTVVYCFYHINR